jgi:hypothetical protein
MAVLNDGYNIYVTVSADFTSGTALYKISTVDFATGIHALYTG